MEEAFRLVQDGGSCEDPELTLVLLLRLGRMFYEAIWFTPAMSAHWEATKDLEQLADYEKRTPYRLRALHLLLDNGQLREVVNLITKFGFALETKVLDRIHQINPHAAKVCLSAPYIKLDSASTGELADWVITHFDYRDPWLFIGFLQQEKKDYDAITKIITHAPEILRCLPDGLLFTDSKSIVETFIFYGAEQKLHMESFNIEGLHESAASFEKSDTDDLTPEATWFTRLRLRRGDRNYFGAHNSAFRRDYQSFLTRLGEHNEHPETVLDDVSKMQEAYDKDPRSFIVAVGHLYFGHPITQTLAEWFVSHYEPSNVSFFACLFERCDTFEAAACIVRHSPALLGHIRDWSIENPNFESMFDEYGALHKMRPTPGKGQDYNQRIRAHDYITRILTSEVSYEDRVLLLESRYPIAPYALANHLRRHAYWAQLEGYLADQTAEYREEYEACHGLIIRQV